MTRKKTYEQPYEKIFKDQLTLRLIILFTANLYKKPLTNEQITRLIMEKNEINYFDLQFNLYDLVKLSELRGFKEEEVYKYEITKEGISDIENLDYKIPLVLKKRLIDTVKKEIESELPITDIVSDFMPHGDEFLSSVKILEKGVEQFGINFLVPKREMAIAVCEYLKNNSPRLYKEINTEIEQII